MTGFERRFSFQNYGDFWPTTFMPLQKRSLHIFLFYIILYTEHFGGRLVGRALVASQKNKTGQTSSPRLGFRGTSPSNLHHHRCILGEQHTSVNPM